MSKATEATSATPDDEAQLAHFAGFRRNVKEIGFLFGLHRAIGGTGPGRRRNVEILNKSALVLLVGCWEAFIEDLAMSAFAHLLSAANSPAQVPAKVLVLAAKSLHGPDDRSVWKLAGDGWRQVLLDHKRETLDRYVGRLNSPRSHNINELFEALVGLKSLSTSWTWPGQNRRATEARLDALVGRRGEIAHRVGVARPVRKKEGLDAVRFLCRLTECSSNAVADHLQEVTRKEAWPHVAIAIAGVPHVRARQKRQPSGL